MASPLPPDPAHLDAAGALADRWRPAFRAFDGGRRYLNTCSLGPLPDSGRAAVTDFLDTWARRGAAAWYDTWLERLAALRAGYARVLGAAPGEVALHPSVSSALGTLASALEYAPRHRVVVTALDFPTVAHQWLARAGDGVEVVVVPSEDGITVPVERVAAAVDERTVLVATSHVCFTTGAVQDIPALARAAHRHGALLLVDGYQAVGQLPVAVHALGADIYLGGGLKWLLGGPGIAFAWVRPALAAALEPRATGWFASRGQFGFDPQALDLHDDARRFETGTPALAAVEAQLAGLALLEEAGLPAVHAATAALARDLVARAVALDLAPRVAPDPAARSAIVPLPAADPAALVARLAGQGITVDARPGVVRLSPHFYNVPEDGRAALDLIAAARPTATRIGASS